MTSAKIITGDCRDVMRAMEANSIDSLVSDPPYGLSFMGKGWDKGVPDVEVWLEALRVAKPGAHLLAFGGTRTHHRLMCAIEDAGWEIRDCLMWIYGSGFPKSHNAGNGWGTALKPGWEPIILARKPITQTVAKNVLEHGTGAINIDACRIGNDIISTHNAPKGTFAGGELNRGSDTESYSDHSGRWPANIMFDEEAGKLLDEQTDGKVGGGHWSKTKVTGFGEFGGGKSEYFGVGEKDTETGGASRFFYCPKASKKEKNLGLEGFDIKDPDNRSDIGKGSWTEKGIAPQQNSHPTVKPVALMEYLCRLITPNSGVILDPFCGSGTTGVAAKNLGFSFIGIELSAEYAAIAQARVIGKGLGKAHWKGKKRSAETKAKMSAKRKLYWENYRKNKIAA